MSDGAQDPRWDTIQFPTPAFLTLVLSPAATAWQLGLPGWPKVVGMTHPLAPVRMRGREKGRLTTCWDGGEGQGEAQAGGGGEGQGTHGPTGQDSVHRHEPFLVCRLGGSCPHASWGFAMCCP